MESMVDGIFAVELGGGTGVVACLGGVAGWRDRVLSPMV
jgi:hypothetical protein